MKYALIAAGAALVSVGAAQAADLAKKAPAAVDYVKVCDTYGAGFFYIPGSDTCLKIGGYTRLIVRSDDGDYGRSYNSFQTAARFRLNVDARSNTELGVLRAFGQVNFNASSGGLGKATTDWTNGADVDKAYLQLGGLTAGYATSKFDFFTGETYEDRYGEYVHDDTTNLIAYTFAFGNGFSATLSLEDSTNSSRMGDYYGGNKAPDVVANVNVSQAWGSAQVMAALHQDYGNSPSSDGGWGWAAGAGVKINLPMLGEGDELGAQVAYADGALKYAGIHYTGLSAMDFDLNGDHTTAWAGIIGLSHNFTSKINGALQFSYASVSPTIGSDDSAYAITGNLTWTPVENFSATAFVEYEKVDSMSDGSTHFGFELKRSF